MIVISDSISFYRERDWYTKQAEGNFNRGNYFKTKKEAEAAFAKIKKFLVGSRVK